MCVCVCVCVCVCEHVCVCVHIFQLELADVVKTPPHYIFHITLGIIIFVNVWYTAAVKMLIALQLHREENAYAVYSH